MIYLLYMILKYHFFNIFGCWNFCVSQSRNSACVEKNLYFVVFLYILYFVVQKCIFKFWCITILKWITYRNVGDWKYSTKTAEKMILPVFLSLHQTFEMRACFFLFLMLSEKKSIYIVILLILFQKNDAQKFHNWEYSTKTTWKLIFRFFKLHVGINFFSAKYNNLKYLNGD